VDYCSNNSCSLGGIWDLKRDWGVAQWKARYTFVRNSKLVPVNLVKKNKKIKKIKKIKK